MDVCRVRAGMAVPDPQTSTVGRVRRRAGIADALPHPVLCRGVRGHAHHYHRNAVSPVLRLALRTNQRPAQGARSSTPSWIGTLPPPGKPPKNSPPSNRHTPTSSTTSPPTKPTSDEPPPAKHPSPPSHRHRRRHAANRRSSPAARHRRTDWAKNCFTKSRDGPAEPGRAHALQAYGPARTRPRDDQGGQAMPPSRSDQGHDDPITGQPTRRVPGIDATPLRAVPPPTVGSNRFSRYICIHARCLTAAVTATQGHNHASLAHSAVLQLLRVKESLLLIGGTRRPL